MSVTELLGAFREEAAMLVQAHARQLAMLAYLDQRGAVAESGYGSLSRLYAELTHVSMKTAREEAARAIALHGTVGVSGAPIPGVLPHVAEAFADGVVNVEHVDKIREFHRRLPAGTSVETWASVETALVAYAADAPPRALTRPMRQLRELLDHDGTEPDDQEPVQPQRQLHMQWRGDELWFQGQVDRETGEKLEALLSPLAKPRPQNATEDGKPDPRTPAGRYGDAFAEAISLAAACEHLPDEGGEPVTVLLTMDYEQLKNGIGAATTMDGQTIPAHEMRRIACDCNIIPTVLGSRGEVLDMGSRVRAAPTRVRHELIVRDGGCAHPYCDRPPAHTQVHHIVHHTDDGLPHPDNMVLLCAYHHRMIHRTPWEVRIRPDGTPEFIPPPWIDPQRRPIPARKQRELPLQDAA